MEKKEKTERPPPLLLIESGTIIGQNQYSLYNVLENGWNTTRIPILFHDQSLLPCNYGWVVLLNPFTHHCSLWNPKSTEIIQLPELRDSSIYGQCVLSKPPTEPGCHILFKAAGKFELAFCQIGDGEFVVEDVEWVETMELFHGDIYGLVGHYKKLMKISFVDKTLEFMPVLNIYPSLQLRPWTNDEQYYLIDDDDDAMLLVCKMSPASYLHQFSDFKVFRIDIDGLECVELLDIGERTIFLSHSGNAFCRFFTGIKTNSIYYTFTERNVFVYNLNNRATTSLLPCLAAHRILHTTYWIEDSFS